MWVVGYGVFVDGDVGFVQCGFCVFVGDVFVDYVYQYQVVLGIVGNDFVVMCDQCGGYCLGVFDYLLLVGFEVWFQCFFECYGFVGDDVYQWIVLDVWEYD